MKINGICGPNESHLNRYGFLTVYEANSGNNNDYYYYYGCNIVIIKTNSDLYSAFYLFMDPWLGNVHIIRDIKKAEWDLQHYAGLEVFTNS